MSSSLSDRTHNFPEFFGDGIENEVQLLQKIGFDSTMRYNQGHIDGDYTAILPDAVNEWEKLNAQHPIPHFPHISIGWDNNPRFKKFRPGVAENNTPENFELALRKAKDYIDTHDLSAPLVTVNSWNEWTETSYLEPDALNGYRYLEAVRNVFGLRMNVRQILG
ncbi:MAG: glycoside hydrolase family 99-like domain-containing protein [Clostridia bacterium]|nr:glycoside hydrolase family 99-like domain-containing protein [Clostridia bacterium]